MKKNNSIIIKDSSISTSLVDSELFISLTDMARNKNPQEPKDVVKNWMRSRTTIEYLGIWEQLNNSDFKGVEFDSLLYEVGNNLIILKKHAQKTYISISIPSLCIGNTVYSMVRKSISRIEY
jgi:hypothetical protein